MDQAIRNKLRGVVTQCRKLLEDSTAQALQGRFGMYAARRKGEVQVEDESRMAHLTDEDRACRKDLLDHLEHIQAIGYKPSEALEQLVREIAFTHLNRLVAYKMMEARGLIREAVSRGLKSQGFFFYLSDHPEDEKLHNGGRQEAAYRNFLDWLGETLSQEIGVLFNPNDPANRIYPPQRVLDEVLALINDGELKDIWSQDETIGWVYQYFTPKELRDKARKESQAPRNSYELAFRNQFFTPRYVVEFLTDNTLGRIWYEMCKGETSLKDRCRYLVRRPTEVFLAEGEEPPAEAKETRDDLSQEELLKQPVHILHRPKKDPRAIKVLDPACGSGHFLLYCFDLLQVIYEEAYDDPDLGASLRRDYPALVDLRRAVPELILKHNLHGIDIDLRATQIAALALWLRCQRAYQDQGLKNGQRPKITRSNIVCAEPMPGEADLLKEFTATLQPKVLGQLVETIFDKMKLAGEAGSLLKIEEEIREAASTAKKEYQEELRRQKEQAGYLPGMAPPRERTLFDFSDMTDSEFLDRAEEEIVAALRQYAEKTSNGKAFRRRLFAEDAERSLGFLDLGHQKYDVVLMNPPFGESSKPSKDYLIQAYPKTKNDVYAAFVEMGLNSLQNRGLLGAITSRTGFFLTSFQKWREDILLQEARPTTVADLGYGVLDTAMVETAAYCVEKHASKGQTVFIRLLALEEKATGLTKAITSLSNKQTSDSIAFVVDPESFHQVPSAPFCYWVSNSVKALWKRQPLLTESDCRVNHGMATKQDFRFLRFWTEVSPELVGQERRWVLYAKGGTYSPYYSDVHLLVDWVRDGRAIHEYLCDQYPYLHGNTDWVLHPECDYFSSGLTYSRRTQKGFNARVLPRGCRFDKNGPTITCSLTGANLFTLLGLINSKAFRSLLELTVAFGSYEIGLLEQMPIPTALWVGKDKICYKTRECVRILQKLDTANEVSHAFQMPALCKVDGSQIRDRLQVWETEVVEAQARMVQCQAELDDIIYSLYAISIEDRQALEQSLGNICVEELIASEEANDDSDNTNQTRGTIDHRHVVSDIVSYGVGIAIGRWDIRFAMGKYHLPELPDPFDPLPVCPPGMLQGPDGLPAKPDDVPSNYPIRIDWDGILVDDPEHQDDIVRRVRDVIEVIWKDRAEAIEKEACEILGVRELRDYFRKPGNGGFWMDHVKRYSKSRRKAPIYWYLRSAKGNYGLWLYYHRLDKDILFKALLNYVEPRIRLEEDRLNTMRARKEKTGSSGREAKHIEKDMDRQEQFVSELRDFADKLRRAANLHIEPDLNDGVVLNIAPLWELAPWKEAKQYWDELVEGKYEWSSIGKQLREKELVT